jgi:hypothetical protein
MSRTKLETHTLVDGAAKGEQRGCLETPGKIGPAVEHQFGENAAGQRRELEAVARTRRGEGYSGIARPLSARYPRKNVRWLLGAGSPCPTIIWVKSSFSSSASVCAHSSG